VDNTFKSYIDSAQSILVLLPTKPSFDEVASGLGIYLTLSNSKSVSISCPSPMLVEFNRLVGVNKISSDFGNKNLVIRFKDYQATDIDRVSYDVDGGEFKLSVIPKSGINAPVKDQIELSYSGISVDTVILVGGAADTDFPAISSKDFSGAKFVHCGKKTLTVNGVSQIISFARPTSSVSELVTYLVKESVYPVDPDIATNLLLGVDIGSEGLTSSAVTADTFQIVADLMRAGGRRQQEGLVKEAFPPGSIPGETPRVHEQVVQSVDQPTQEQPEDTTPPNDWLTPKIYKGTSVS